MQINAINNYECSTPKKAVLNNNRIQTSNAVQDNAVSFTGSDKKNSKAMRNAILALCFLPVAGSVVTSCEKEVYAEAHAEANANASVIDTTGYCHPGDTIIKWYYKYQRPIPLDTLYNNLQNWDIDGTSGNKNDSLAKRNVVHYEGTREWEYGSKEIGDINILESATKKTLVYDTEFLDYKGNHESYGKRVLRIPTGNFTIKTKDGKTLHSPKGLFVEEYKNENDEKGGSIYDCTLKTRAFVQTNGDTLNVAKRKGTSEFVETGKVAKGYLGAGSILLKSLIGEYPTDDHYVDFEVDAVDDKSLRLMYVKAMDENEE